MLIRDVYKYYIYAVLSNLLFCAPIVYVFYKTIGLTFGQIFICETIFSICVAVFEVPTGAIADRFSKKLSIVLGMIAVIISNLLCAVANGFGMIVVSQIILAVGIALTSGADTALLYSSLLQEKREHEFKKYQGTVKFLSLLSMSAAALLGGVIASLSIRATFVISALAFGISLIVILAMREPNDHSDSEPLHYWKVITESAQLIARSKWLLWIILFSSTLLVSFRLLIPTMQGYMELSNLPIGYFGLASTYFFLTSALGAKAVGYSERVLGEWLYVTLSALFVLPILILSQLHSELAFLLFGALYFTTSAVVVFVDHEVLKATPKQQHATVLSFNSLFARVIFVVLSPFFGYLLGLYGLTEVFLLLGVALVGVFLVFLVLKPKVLAIVN